MFPYRVTEPNQTGQLTRWDIPVNRWLDVQFEQGLHDRGGAAIGRAVDDFFADGPEISPEEANRLYGLPTLKFDSPINEERAKMMHERKRAELTRQAYMESADHSWFSPKAVAGFGAQMVGSMLSPVDVGLMFLPVVGSSAKAGGIAKLGGSALRQSLARGLITEEAIAELAPRFPKFTASFIEGTVGNAVAEIPLFIQNVRDQAIYGPEDAAVNVLAGGLFASGLRLGLSGLGRALEAAAFIHRSVSPETRETMFRKAVDDAFKGNDIKVDDLVHIDDNVILANAGWSEAKARQEAVGEVAGKPLEGEWRVSVQQPQLEGKVPGYVQLDEIKDGINIRSVSPEKLRQEGHLVPDYSQLPQGQYKMEDANKALNGELHNPEKLTEMQEAAVEQLVTKKRDEFRVQNENKISIERQAEVQRQVAAGKILPDTEIERVQMKGEAADSTDAATITEDVANIEQELKADTGRRVAELSDEERESLQSQLDEELGRVEETVYKPRDKAVDAAIPCVLEGALS